MNQNQLYFLSLNSEFHDDEAVEDNRTEEEMTNEERRPDGEYLDPTQLYLQINADRCEWCLRDGLVQLRKKVEGEKYCTQHLKRLRVNIPIKQAHEQERKNKRVAETLSALRITKSILNRSKIIELYNKQNLYDAELALKLMADQGMDSSAFAFLGLNSDPTVPPVSVQPPVLTPMPTRHSLSARTTATTATTTTSSVQRNTSARSTQQKTSLATTTPVPTSSPKAFQPVANKEKPSVVDVAMTERQQQFTGEELGNRIFGLSISQQAR
jgi:hypothetical protein